MSVCKRAHMHIYGTLLVCLCVCFVCLVAACVCVSPPCNQVKSILLIERKENK